MANIGIYFRGDADEARAKRAKLAAHAEAMGLKFVDYMEMLADGRLVAVPAADAFQVPEESGLLALIERAALSVEDEELAEQLRQRRQALLEALT